MSKLCVKCGYIRKPSDTAPDYECPKCGVIYEKAEAAIRQKNNSQAKSSIPFSKIDSANGELIAHKKSVKISKALPLFLITSTAILVLITLAVLFQSSPKKEPLGSQLSAQASQAWCGFPMKDGTVATRECDLDNLCKDWIFFRRKINEYEAAGNAAKADDARRSFEKTNVWLSAYEEKDVGACIAGNEKPEVSGGVVSSNISELVKKYEIAKTEGRSKDSCDYAGKIKRAYLAMEGSTNHLTWAEKEQSDCSTYKSRAPSAAQLNQERACLELKKRDPSSDKEKCMNDAGYVANEDGFRMCLRTSTNADECNSLFWIPKD